MKDCIKKFIKAHWLLIPLAFTVLFGFGYQAIPLFSWFYIPIILIYTRNRPRRNITTVYITSSISFALAFLGNFRTTSTGPPFPLAWLLILASFLVNTILIIMLAAERYVMKCRQCIYTRVLLFPALYTSLWFIVGRFGVLGDYPSLSTVLINWSDFSQVASLSGRALLDFLLALSGTIALEIPSFPFHLLAPAQTTDLFSDSSVSDDTHDQHLDKRQWVFLLVHPVTIYTLIMAIAFTFGGMYVNIRPGSFYQVTYPEYIPRTEPVGCVVGPGDLYPDLQSAHDLWFNKSTELAEAGAKIIIWSELTAIVNNEQEEEAFLQRTKEFALLHKVYIGVTYKLIEPVQKNKLVLVTKGGEIGINYNKAHPVPGIELQPAGPNVLQYIDTEEFGRIGAAICFDFNFADFIGQASKYNVDIMLQPSWTWGPIGTYHQQGNILRPVENGFTLFRCVSQGVSGIFEPTLNGVFNQKVASNNVEKYIFYLPIQKRLDTVYGYIGDSFSYLCIFSSVAFIFMTWRNSRRYNRLTL